MTRIKNFSSSPFGSALLGGFVVAMFGWLAIAAGWIEGDSDQGAVPLAAAPLTQPASSEDSGKGLSVNEIYDRTSPGVAFISATQTTASPAPFSPFGGGGAQRAVATGSGFVIDDDGHIVTNAHVVDGASDMQVKLGDSETSYDAKLVGKDESSDIAVIQVDAPADELDPLELGDSSGMDVGDPVVAIGNPFGLDRTATAGIVSALQRQISAPNGFTISDVIQTDAAINPGNSGGPLLDASGAVVGVNSQIESSIEGNVGIGFAVPINTAHEVAQQLIEGGSVEHAFLGISGGDLTPELADILNLDHDGGALVQSVVPGSPADKAGIEAGDATVSVGGQRVRVGGDLIVEADGQPVDSMDDVIAAVNSKKPGEDLELKVLRGGDERTISVELADRPANASG